MKQMSEQVADWEYWSRWVPARKVAKRRPGKPSSVDIGIVAFMLGGGSTLEQVGAACGVTRERIRQLAKIHGLENGQPTRAKRAVEAVKAARDRLSFGRWGCSRAEYRGLGRGVTDAFQRQRQTSSGRGVAWEFANLWEWWCVWRDSGKWEERGRGADRYAMTRRGDCGPYATWNVVIKTNRENSQECRARGLNRFVKGE